MFVKRHGRDARLMADLLEMSLGGDRFSWGSISLCDASDVRRRYIAVLQTADNHDVGPLLRFARS
jgi:hypothetical protein